MKWDSKLVVFKRPLMPLLKYSFLFWNRKWVFALLFPTLQENRAQLWFNSFVFVFNCSLFQWSILTCLTGLFFFWFIKIVSLLEQTQDSIGMSLLILFILYCWSRSISLTLKHNLAWYGSTQNQHLEMLTIIDTSKNICNNGKVLFNVDKN